MVIISNMNTQHNIWHLPSESNHVMSTNGKVSHLLIIVNYCAFSPNSRGHFLPQIPCFYIFFRYLNNWKLFEKVIWKLLRRSLSHNICINFSNSNLLLKSTTFKSTAFSPVVPYIYIYIYRIYTQRTLYIYIYIYIYRIYTHTHKYICPL